MRLTKQGVWNFVKAVMFVLITISFIPFLTYYFRPTIDNGRSIILDYEAEESSLDVVYIGASPVVYYWDPMRAWNEQGFASRNYAVLSMHKATCLTALKDALKTQNPKVVVMDARRFLSSGSESGARNYLDMMDIGWDRLKAVHYYCRVMDVSLTESISYYIDLIKYHDNYEAFEQEIDWNSEWRRKVEPDVDRFKGFTAYVGHVYCKDPSDRLSDESRELQESSMETYIDIIEYCQENEIQLIFVAAPWQITEKASQGLNRLAEVAESYGVDFLDANRYYKEMGLDFSKDFINAKHVNIFGAEKFTSFVAEYLAKKYSLPDRRDEAEYSSWNEYYQIYQVKMEEMRVECEEIYQLHMKARAEKAESEEISDEGTTDSEGETSE